MLEVQRLDKTVPIPLYFQLKKLLLAEIKNGSYQVDSLIPTEKELSEIFQISRTTVRQAITELVQEGWLYRVKSKGTFVARVKIKQDFIKRLESYNEQIIRTGRTPRTEVLKCEVVKIPERVASLFDLSLDRQYICLSRLRFADDEPNVSVETYLPYDECSFILSHDFNRESMYNVLATNEKTRICRVTRILEAVAATVKDVKNLNIRNGKPIQLSQTFGYNQYNELIECTLARYRGDRNRFEVDLLIET